VTSTLASIVGCGAYVPRLRLSRKTIAANISWANPSAAQARGERALCNWDEDAITMAVEAARSCPDHTGAVALTLASTTLPFADRSNATLVAAALNLPATLETADASGSLRAGTGALAAAVRRGDQHALVIASEHRRTRVGSSAELSYGDAAAALLVAAPQQDSLADIVAIAHTSANFVDHYRASDSDFDYALEERWVRESGLATLAPPTIQRALADAQVAPTQVAHAVFSMSANNAQRLAKSCGLEHAQVADDLIDSVGDCGTARPFVQLVQTLEGAKAGDIIVLGCFAQGFDCIVMRVGTKASSHKPFTTVLKRRAEELSYVRYLSHNGLVDVDFGMRAERGQRSAHTTAWRKDSSISAFVGGRCRSCAAVQFPLSRVCVNPACRATDTQEPCSLANSTGRVKTFTEDWQAYSARPPYVYGNVEFAAGGNLLMEITDANAGEIAVGDAVRFVFRVKDYDRARNFRRYFWKAVKS
jgi:hydroxymethylglutaryl-CoA synthase